jgi:hypothetical protein
MNEPLGYQELKHWDRGRVLAVLENATGIDLRANSALPDMLIAKAQELNLSESDLTAWIIDTGGLGWTPQSLERWVRYRSEPLGWSAEGDIVTLRMTQDDWCQMLMILGAGSMRLAWPGAFALVNRICAGNPNFTPYEIPIDPDAAGAAAEGRA